MTDLLDVLRRRNPQLPDLLVKPLLGFFLVARQVREDLELNIILLVIASRTVEHPDFARMDLARRLGEVAVFPSRGVNTRSIAEYSGIPRETVRRKVAELVRAGWIARRGTSLHFTAEGFRATTAVRQAMERLAVQYYEVLDKELRRTP